MMAAELVTVSEASKRLGISKQTIRDWMRRGRIARYKSEIGTGGRTVYVDVTEIAEKRTPRRDE